MGVCEGPEGKWMKHHVLLTGEIGSGHLNRDGHRAIAAELYRYLSEGKEM